VGNVAPTITVAVRRRLDSASSPTPFVVENKTFPIAVGAPIELIANGTKQPLTPAALTPGRRAALLVGDGAVNEIDLFAKRAPTASTSYYSPYRFYSTRWFGLPHRHFVGWNRGWNRFHGSSGVGYTGHYHTFAGRRVVSHGRSVSGVVSGGGAHVHHVSHKTGTGHHQLAIHHAHTGHQGHKASHHHVGQHRGAGHHAHSVKHSHRGGHRAGGHHGGHHKK
jgi:hypothetical protein